MTATDVSARQLASRMVVVLDDKELEDDLVAAFEPLQLDNEFSSRGIMLAERSIRRAPWIGIAMGGNSTRSILSAIQLPTPLFIPSIRSRNSRTAGTLTCGFKRR